MDRERDRKRERETGKVKKKYVHTLNRKLDAVLVQILSPYKRRDGSTSWAAAMIDAAWVAGPAVLSVINVRAPHRARQCYTRRGLHCQMLVLYKRADAL